MGTVLNKKAFKLPRIEKEKFILLLHLGCEYNREQAVFSIKSYNNIEKLMDTIGGILKSEVVFLQSCTRCGKDFACGDCKYDELCTSKNFPLSCVCSQCLMDSKCFGESLEKF